MEQLKAWIEGERGRLTRLAEACEITHSAICQWTRVPVERVAVVERVTGIKRTDLRPDVYEVA
jgi:DNA-binding transcriptional regulator YdaS (Cro superfamily)